MKKSRLQRPFRPALFIALVLSIPAFYLLLEDADARLRDSGSLLYALTALLVGIDLWLRRGREPDTPTNSLRSIINRDGFSAQTSSSQPSFHSAPVLPFG